mmetsp:Transcript_1126/g.1153  ORF Transcript_1126/g.1153 Transcript_1126/m.1153 type:complete len:114 (+) Transcript_1126:92-433(+)
MVGRLGDAFDSVDSTDIDEGIRERNHTDVEDRMEGRPNETIRTSGLQLFADDSQPFFHSVHASDWISGKFSLNTSFIVLQDCSPPSDLRIQSPMTPKLPTNASSVESSYQFLG